MTVEKNHVILTATGHIGGAYMNPTMKDIAKACGVSKTTISRYLNGSGYVSKEAAEKIEAKIKELNYVPSVTARNLSNKTSNEIAVVIPEVTNPFFSEIFKGISKIADREGLNILYFDTDNNAEKELKVLSMLRSYRLKGIILAPATAGLADTNYKEAFLEAATILRVPIVLIDRDIEYVDWDAVLMKNTEGAYECIQLLINAGHKSIGAITGDLTLNIARERQAGFLKAVNEAGLESNCIIKEGDFSIQTAYEKTLEILEQEVRPTALFTPNNLSTLGALKAIFQKGLSIPKDISITCFDDIEVLDILNMNLTVVHRDTVDMGKKAAELLLERLAKPKAPTTKIMIEPDIIVRGSEQLI